MQKCLQTFATCTNWWSQCEQEYDFSPVWSFMCVFKWWSQVNRLWHSLHSKGLSLVWVLSWFWRTCLYPKDLLQTLQVKTFSLPVPLLVLLGAPLVGDWLFTGFGGCCSSWFGCKPTKNGLVWAPTRDWGSESLPMYFKGGDRMFLEVIFSWVQLLGLELTLTFLGREFSDKLSVLEACSVCRYWGGGGQVGPPPPEVVICRVYWASLLR